MFMIPQRDRGKEIYVHMNPIYGFGARKGMCYGQMGTGKADIGRMILG